jgi:hypothetical protein
MPGSARRKIVRHQAGISHLRRWPETAHVQMTTDEMRQAIEGGETAEVVFWRDRLQSIIQIWKYRGDIILTWEEAPDGAQYDESRYRKDWRRVFASAEEVFQFLELHKVALESFELAK